MAVPGFLCKKKVPVSARKLSSAVQEATTIAVVLSGCGVQDGTEIHEASALMVALSREAADYRLYAPDKPQMHTINHLTGEEIAGDNRNVYIESARIARGKLDRLVNLNVTSHSAVIFPGGFGAAKNLSDFAVNHADCTVDEQVSAVIRSFHEAKKPIGLCCIAPVLAAKVLAGCEVTMGMESEGDPRWPHASACAHIRKMGSVHVVKDVNELYIDEKNQIITTPAYMCETKLHEVHDGVAKLVRAVIHLSKKDKE